MSMSVRVMVPRIVVPSRESASPMMPFGPLPSDGLPTACSTPVEGLMVMVPSSLARGR